MKVDKTHEGALSALCPTDPNVLASPLPAGVVDTTDTKLATTPQEHPLQVGTQLDRNSGSNSRNDFLLPMTLYQWYGLLIYTRDGLTFLSLDTELRKVYSQTDAPVVSASSDTIKKI